MGADGTISPAGLYNETMDILWNTLTALLPLYIMLAAGVAARKGGVIPEDLVPPMNKVVFKILLPCSLFVSIYKADLAGEAVGRMLLFLAIVIPLAIVACLFAATKMGRIGSRM
ncbi:MAG: AEC family transporter [Bacteroidaceae bacterium]|nr:AEC family transporter [Bacteroidaceae bacterium]